MGSTKTKLRKGETALGAWITIPSPVVVEVLQMAQFDWLAIDLEHAPFDNRTIYEMVRASNGRCDILARLPSGNAVMAEKVLDAGADGIIVPNVRTYEEAVHAGRIARFAPDGSRSMAICRANRYGCAMSNSYWAHNDNVIVVIMMEQVQAVERTAELAAAARADAVLIGPYDLSSSMGIPAQFENPKFKEAVQQIRELSSRHCAPGIHVAAVNKRLVAEYKEAGFRFIACGLDTEMLKFGAFHTL